MARETAACGEGRGEALPSYPVSAWGLPRSSEFQPGRQGPRNNFQVCADADPKSLILIPR